MIREPFAANDARAFLAKVTTNKADERAWINDAQQAMQAFVDAARSGIPTVLGVSFAGSAAAQLYVEVLLVAEQFVAAQFQRLSIVRQMDRNARPDPELKAFVSITQSLADVGCDGPVTGGVAARVNWVRSRLFLHDGLRAYPNTEQTATGTRRAT